jgi:hypothetical protein
LDTGAFPKISEVVLTDDSTVTLTGTDFFTGAEYSGEVKFSGVKADTVTLDSATTVTAKWNMGVPVNNEAIPSLIFKKTSSEEYFSKSMVSLKNPLSLSGSSQSLSCSFNGGCLYEIQAKGLSTLLKDQAETNYI